MVWMLLFALCLFSLIYTYVLYPLTMRVWAKGEILNNDDCALAQLPNATIIIAAYNEESVIETTLSKIKESVNFKQLEVLIGSDGSTDKTNEIVERFAAENVNIHLYVFERNGKVAILNALMQNATHQLVVLMDANIKLSNDCLPKMLMHFTDNNIGLVGANIKNVTNNSKELKDISPYEDAYVNNENELKYNEGVVFGSMMGPFGGCYAIRKELYKNIPTNFLVDDFHICMNVLKQNKKAVLAKDAWCYEQLASTLQSEFNRKRRISAGNFQNLMVFKTLLFKGKNGVGFTFFSHKVLRWKGPFLFLYLVLSSLMLFKYHLLFGIMFLGLMLLMCVPILNWLLLKLKIRIPLMQKVAYFVLMNIALHMGFVDWLTGIKSGIWQPTKRK